MNLKDEADALGADLQALGKKFTNVVNREGDWLPDRPITVDDTLALLAATGETLARVTNNLRQIMYVLSASGHEQLPNLTEPFTDLPTPE